jgi:hypothetical protein
MYYRPRCPTDDNIKIETPTFSPPIKLSDSKPTVVSVSNPIKLSDSKMPFSSLADSIKNLNLPKYDIYSCLQQLQDDMKQLIIHTSKIQQENIQLTKLLKESKDEQEYQKICIQSIEEFLRDERYKMKTIEQLMIQIEQNQRWQMRWGS